MRKSAWVWVVLAVAGWAGGVRAQEGDKPGPEHAALKKLEGTWDATVKGPGGESKGTMTWKTTLGGLWLSADFKGDFGGMQFAGHGMTGYDPRKKKYVDYWFDSMSASSMTFEGNYEKDKKTLVMVGEGPGPDGKPTK